MTRLGKYELIERLAIGGMAELFKAQMLGDHGFKKTVVIKKILPQLAANSTFVNMFVDEARITAMLDHPNIVQVFEFGQEGDELYLVMQLVDGTDLFDIMGKTKQRDEPMPPELAAYVAREILDALDYAHNATDDSGRMLGIVHRDVSPGNVLISNRGNVMLTDFGIAWAYERHQKTEAGKLKGKFGYMSPEQVAGERLDERSDVFSTGVLLAEMLINRHLFVGQSDLDILLMVRDANLDRLLEYGQHVPTDLMTVVLEALRPRRESRYQSAAKFRDALSDWLFSHQKRASAHQLAAFIEFVDRDKAGDDADSGLGRGIKSSATAAAAAVRGVHRAAQGSDPAADGFDAEHTKPEDQRERITAPRAPRDSQMALGSQPRARTSQPMPARSRNHPVDAGATIRMGAITADSLPDSLPDSPPERPSRALSAPILLAEASESGDFSRLSPLSLMFRLAATSASGLLMVERGDIAKEAYFKEGSPQFVGSNVPTERLGHYLVGRGAITQDQLERALTVLPHFGGHLLDGLISQDILEPLEALRHLNGQVSAKLVDVCLWTEGTYQWYEGRNTPKRARRLQLDTFGILGLATQRAPVPRVVEWAKEVRSHRVRQRFAGTDLSRFGLGDAMMRAQVLLENHRTTVTDLAGRVREPAARLAFVRALFLLVHCGLAELEPPS